MFVHFVVPMAWRVSHRFVVDLGDLDLYCLTAGLCHLLIDFYPLFRRHHDINTDFLTFRHVNHTRSCDFSGHLDGDFLIDLDRYLSLNLHLLGHRHSHLHHHVHGGRHHGSDRLHVLLRSVDLHWDHPGHVNGVILRGVIFLLELHLSGHFDVLIDRGAGLGWETGCTGVDCNDAGTTRLASGDLGHPLFLVDGLGHHAVCLLHGHSLLLGHLRLHLGHQDHSGPLNVLLHLFHDNLLAWLLLGLPHHPSLIHHLLNHSSFLDGLLHRCLYDLLLGDLFLHDHLLKLFLLD